MLFVETKKRNSAEEYYCFIIAHPTGNPVPFLFSTSKSTTTQCRVLDNGLIVRHAGSCGG